MSEAITITTLREQFFNGRGFPKKEYLKNIQQILRKAGIKLSKEFYKRKYQLHLAYACMCAIRSFCNGRNILFITWKPGEGESVLYGFTQDKDKVNQYIKTIENRKIKALERNRQVKAIACSKGQLRIDFK